MSLEREAIVGIAASPGIAIGPVAVFDRRSVPVPRRHVLPEHIEPEVVRLERAMLAARNEIEAIRDALPSDAGPDHRLLLEAQIMMHSDALLLSSAAAAIRGEHINAEWALRRAVDGMRAKLDAAPEAYFRERADDVAHVGEHILRVLTGVSLALPPLNEDTILVASDLSPAEAAQLHTGVRALVTDTGSASSHTAILARALQVPAVVGVTDVTKLVGPGDIVIVDALRGEVVLRPDAEEQARARARAERFTAFKGKLRESERRATETTDGIRVSILANVELELDVATAKREGADGIGLYRTEFLYLDRNEAPSEEEQAALYTRVVRRNAPKPVVFRTFDLGADKLPLGMRKGPNPELGIRGLRVAWERPELLVTQLRALLRASVAGNMQVMFPMVSGVEDMRRARVLFSRARDDLDAEGAPYGPLAIGSMLEIPSAVLMADRLADECDFFSIGTNDLTQYTMAVDRGDPRVAHLARSLDPAILRLLDHALKIAKERNKPICVCGDLAADPVAVPLLVGLGFETLSMSMAAIPLVREIVARLDQKLASSLAREALEQVSARDVERLVSERLGSSLGDLWEEHGIELPRP